MKRVKINISGLVSMIGILKLGIVKYIRQKRLGNTA